jgi:hypothetical protein
MWSGDKGPDTQTRFFRRSFHVVGEVESASIQLFAEAKYLLYVNGKFIDRGPCFHHPMVAPFDQIDLTEHLNLGSNVIAILVQAINIGLHNHIPNGEPGVCAHIHWQDETGDHQITADQHWRVSQQTGWLWPAPKRTWAIGPIEIFDMTQSQPGWQEIDFDDSHWQIPDIQSLGSTIQGGIQIMDRPTPSLKYQWVGLYIHNLTKQFITDTPVVKINVDESGEVHSKRLENLSAIEQQNHIRLTQDDQHHDLHIDGLTPDRGMVLYFDLGAMHVGQILLEATCPSDGIIDIAWQEAQSDNTPCYSRKGACYADRIIASQGKLNWRPITFSGMRYVSLILRGFTGNLLIHRIGVHASVPDLSWNKDFLTSDTLLDDIHAICQRTICVGSQESLMDCPTREQAAYVGDGLPVAKWIGRLTGDWRYYKDMIIEQFRRQAPNGLIRSTLYSWRDDTLVDYNLIAILGLRDYLKITGDQNTVESVLPAARKLMSWFTNQLSSNKGLLRWQWQEQRPASYRENQYETDRPQISNMNLFIDHAGMGWHCIDDAGIDRRGNNAALHAFLSMALSAMVEIETFIGQHKRAEQYQTLAQKLKSKAHATFYSQTHHCYIDGILDGKQLNQISEQTNTLAILANWCSDEQGKTILNHLLQSNDKTIARNGYYFWLYTFEALKQLDMIPMSLEMIRKHWQPIIAAGSSTVWETMAGDHLDSHCHPWSCVPASTLITDILGLGSLESEQPEINPRCDLLTQASGTMYTRHGKATIHWKVQENHIHLHGELPTGMHAKLRLPDSNTEYKVQGKWQHLFVLRQTKQASQIPSPV